MHIAIIFFNLWEAGGVNTITSGLINGFERLGHIVDYYHASPTGNLRGLDQTRVVGSRYIRLKADQIGYHNDKDIARFRRLVREKYDFVIFTLPCPHQTKSSYGDDRTWQRLYQLDKPIFVIFHDNLWDKYYKWLEEVNDKISGCLYTVTNAAQDSLRKFPKNHFMFLPVLLDTKVDTDGSHKKIVWLPQSKKWKGFKEFIEQIPYLRYRVDMYNIGIMYYDLNKKNKELWEAACRLDYYAKVHPKFNGEFKVNSHAMMDFFGLVHPEQIETILRSAACSVDLTGMVGGDRFKGQITCTMLEPMALGTVSVVDESMVTYKGALLKGRDDIVWPISGKNDIASRLNYLMDRPKLIEKISKRARKYVRKYHDSAIVVKHLLLPFMEQCSGSWKLNESSFDEDYKCTIKESLNV